QRGAGPVVGRRVARHVRTFDPDECVAERDAIGVADREAVRRRRLTGCGRVQGEVMVETASAKEGYECALAMGDLEAERTGVEGDGAIEVSDPKADVTDF